MQGAHEPTPRQMANAIRALSMDAVQQARSGHPGMPMGMADVVTALWTTTLLHHPDVPDWPDRDRFILSAGHGSMLHYALLYLTGYRDMTIEDIRSFRQLGARTCGHPEYGEAAAIETTTGPLGQGLANAVGMALAEVNMAARFGHDIVNHYTYAIVGDGCLMEGISQEAATFAAHHKLSKLIVLFDDNGISIDGPTSLSTSEDQCQRFVALGWDVQKVNGHDPVQITEALYKAKTTNAPSFIACKTTIGYGAPTKAGTSASHGAPLGEEEIAGAREAMGWDAPPFEIPEPILRAWRDSVTSGVGTYESWKQRFDALGAETQAEFTRLMQRQLPDGWQQTADALKQSYSASPVNEATRKSSHHVLESLTPHIPEMIGGSADLTGSNLTKTGAFTPLTDATPEGRYIYYGIREHAMGAIMNGMQLHGGIIPYGGTFLVFSDYMRTPIRLSALMKQGVIYVMTHDSIGVGEDGPTHQPIEHLASLRAIPGLQVFRPADRVEVLECWSLAIADRTTPSILVLTRQHVEQQRLTYHKENRCATGGYVLHGSDADAVVIIASGSEVTLATQAHHRLKEKNIHARVVSLPSMELFFAQSPAYRDEVLGNGLPRIGVEAACSLGWHRLLGEEGIFIGADRFGLSGPAQAVYEKLGITTGTIVASAEKLLKP
ncbi:MAG: transketolase [Sphaerospermopsis sp. SIO1G2]|nr:transketolase [Sphaerospermopsis sp. SIO1G2]